MQRVVYETRQQCEAGVESIRVCEQVANCDLDLQRSTVRGQPVKILTHHPVHFGLPKTTPAIRPCAKVDYQLLKRQLERHYRRSYWKQLVMMMVEELIKDLEWEVVLGNAGFKTKSFTYHWERFKKLYLKSIPSCRRSWPTRNMLPRLEQQPWLLAYLEEDKN
ncbi:hypothetical protein pEaSNUABM11_00111 [Erwinia phage pEa_SNUABM_11]|nr:hypothetical protein pEaSNUABM11_00111 [Erwinia phage pEa_SNUABM_11]